MKDSDCVQFMQAVLPHLRMRWPGFRKVRRQVCKRINRRMQALELLHVSDYREYLEHDPAEWDRLDEMCRISISRFYRDIRVFDLIRTDVLPTLARQAVDRDRNDLRVWSAGCASGEEAYTLKLIWEIDLKREFGNRSLAVTASDADDHMLERARRGSYPASSLKDFPSEWIDRAFQVVDREYRIRNEYRDGIHWIRQDIRSEVPEGSFDLVTCRHLVFTYFDAALQAELAAKIVSKLDKGGFLIIGKHEELASATELGLTLQRPNSGVYRSSLA